MSPECRFMSPVQPHFSAAVIWVWQRPQRAQLGCVYPLALPHPRNILLSPEITPTAPAETAEEDEAKSRTRNCKSQALFSHQAASVPHTFWGGIHFCPTSRESPRAPAVSVLPVLGFSLRYLELSASLQLLCSLSHDI